MKKTVVVLVAILMLIALAAPVFAAVNSGTITISNATIGKEYAVYKVFDATYAGSGIAYSYTKTGENDALYSALNAADSPFTLSEPFADGFCNVFLKDGKTGVDISAFFNEHANLLGNTVAKETAGSSVVVFDGIDYGYYYITSSLGNTVTIDSVAPDVVVIDKNQNPGWNGTVFGKSVSTSADGEHSKNYDASIGDTVYFKISAYCPMYSGSNRVHEYIFTDNLDNGFTYNGDIVVVLNGNILTHGDHYDISTNGQTITVSVKATDIENYPAEGNVVITYSATIDEDATYKNTNTVSMSWKVISSDGSVDDTAPSPDAPQYPSDSEANIYVYGFKVQKYSEAVIAGNELNGAKFRLYDAKTGGNEISLVKIADGQYRVAADGEEGVDIEAGYAQIFGLRETSYYLEETEAPAGYNRLSERHEVVIIAESATNGILNNTQNIINNSGALLPSTGGIGTTLFYVLGSILAIGAAILLITKKRMNESES